MGLGIWSYLEVSRALTDSNAAKLKSQRMSAGLALDRGLQLCREGKVSDGMLWMAESLEVNPEEDRGFADLGAPESHRLADDHDRSTILDRPRTMGALRGLQPGR